MTWAHTTHGKGRSKTKTASAKKHTTHAMGRTLPRAASRDPWKHKAQAQGQGMGKGGRI